MTKISFKDDYSDTGHPQIARALAQQAGKPVDSYGSDEYSEKARTKLRKQIKQPKADIYFVSGGTQANLIAVAAMLRPFEAVLACESGHIIHHEAGAIEATGHKIIYGQGVDGKLTPETIVKILKNHTDEHMVHPRAVFISQATEMGTVYSKKEVQEISKLCKKHNLYLYIDGARMGAALMASDLNLVDVARYADIFYIGGTKNGALFGEALVVINTTLKNKFVYHIKQRGGLLAKGSSVGIQFLELFTKNLYFDIAKIRHKKSAFLKKGLEKMGVNFLTTPETNQFFPILDNVVIAKLERKYAFYRWRKVEKGKTSVRLVVSHDTKDSSTRSLLKDLKAIMN